MIRHLVLFTVADEKKGDKNALIAEAAERLVRLVGVVPGLKTMEVHTDELGEGNHDFAIVATMDDIDAVRAYATHPAHVEVAKFIGTFRGERAAIDYHF